MLRFLFQRRLNLFDGLCIILLQLLAIDFGPWVILGLIPCMFVSVAGEEALRRQSERRDFGRL